MGEDIAGQVVVVVNVARRDRTRPWWLKPRRSRLKMPDDVSVFSRIFLRFDISIPVMSIFKILKFTLMDWHSAGYTRRSIRSRFERHRA